MIANDTPCRIDPGASPDWQLSEAQRNVRIAHANRDPGAVSTAKRELSGVIAGLLLKAGGYA